MTNIQLSPFAQKVKTWYDMGLWTYDMVENAYKKGKITLEEFKEITQAN